MDEYGNLLRTTRDFLRNRSDRAVAQQAPDLIAAIEDLWGRLRSEQRRREGLEKHARMGAKLCDLFFEFDGDPACMWEHVDAFDDQLREDGCRPSLGSSIVGEDRLRTPDGEGE